MSVEIGCHNLQVGADVVYLTQKSALFEFLRAELKDHGRYDGAHEETWVREVYSKKVLQELAVNGASDTYDLKKARHLVCNFCGS